MAGKNFRDLFRIDKHTLDLGPLVGSSHPALQAHIRAPARRRAGQHGCQVTGSETHQRVDFIEGRGRPVSPTSPSATGSPVPGRTTSTIRFSLTTHAGIGIAILIRCFKRRLCRYRRSHRPGGSKTPRLAYFLAQRGKTRRRQETRPRRMEDRSLPDSAAASSMTFR